MLHYCCQFWNYANIVNVKMVGLDGYRFFRADYIDGYQENR